MSCVSEWCNKSLFQSVDTQTQLLPVDIDKGVTVQIFMASEAVSLTSFQ